MKVQIYECSETRRRMTSVVELPFLLRYAGERLPPAELDRFKRELETEGKSRLDGETGWFEYEMQKGS